ncbi:hypothetical protein LSH36_840g02021 [Paralvinella palmiformis]|uniref:Pre-mRNA-splicing factor SLU7 n=1 Tax=Paralvinella palmiformis TaxID=53620 RepID=A0AAD9IYV3_9ANNE|nr:hypothetical protein LSH36_840g02021 [Paralvinella palmiformis]
MSFQLNVPPSVISRIAKKAEESGTGEEDGTSQESAKTREDWRKLKELEEARKAGTAPAMKDEEGRPTQKLDSVLVHPSLASSGSVTLSFVLLEDPMLSMSAIEKSMSSWEDINPHIPQYIMQAPWYFGATTPTLRHQRPQEEKQKLFADDWFKRGVKEGSVVTKFRKGACENCGAMTHKKKDCLERPRKIGARFTGKDFAPDEYIQPDLEFSYDGKRDRWNGYNPAEHKKIIEEYQKIDEAKRLLKAQRIEELIQKGEIGPEEAKKAVEDEDEDDEDKYAEDVDMPGQKFESKQRITVRNLRIREDTAKYLYNLDVSSAYYDPKTRSMRENPLRNTFKDPQELPYAGDNFVRWSGDAMEMAKQQLFAWEAYEKGAEVNLQADPTKLDLLTKEYQTKKEEYKVSTKESILEKYGGQEHLDAPPKQLLLAQTEEYVEYSRCGTVLKGQEKVAMRSVYEEDAYPQNHTSVWGSYWKDGQWGYGCCHSFIQESYCTGAAGKTAEQTTMPAIEGSPVVAVKRQPSIDNSLQPFTPSATITQPNEEHISPHSSPLASSESSSSDEEEKQKKRRKKEKKRAKKKMRKQKEKEKKKKLKKHKRRHSSADDDESSESEDEDAKRERRIIEAIRKEEARMREVDLMMQVDERKRPYNITYDYKAPDEEEIEAYQRKRMRDEDPMAHFMK